MKLEKLNLAKFSSLENGELNTVIGGATSSTRRSLSVVGNQVVSDSVSSVDSGTSVTGSASASNGVVTTDS
jgi:natural product precursor